jgi:outer membrane lipoprotein-sorting protein
VAAGLEPAPTDVDVTAVMRGADAALHGNATYYEARISVDSDRDSERRAFALTLIEDRTHRRVFARITAPEDDVGTAFLRLDPNLWVYIPRFDRILLVPEGAIDESFLASDFTHRDLLHASRELDEYDHEVLGLDARPPNGPPEPVLVVESTPRAGVTAAWARIVTWVGVADGAPRRREFYGASELKRTLVFTDIREIGGRSVPHRWTLRPADGDGRTTRLELDVIRFEPPIDEAMFTSRNLKPPE